MLTFVNNEIIVVIVVYLTRKNGLIASFAKIDFFPEIVSTKLTYCLNKI